MRARERHFMPVSLLDNQLATLEPLEPGERGTELDCALDPTTLARTAHGRLAVASALVAGFGAGVDTR
jgi:gluconate kinase